MTHAYHSNSCTTHSPSASVNQREKKGAARRRCQNVNLVASPWATAGNRNACSRPRKGILANPALTHSYHTKGGYDVDHVYR